MATLNDLLTVQERAEFDRHVNYGIDRNTNFKNLTVQNLSDMAFFLINVEYKGKMPACVLSAEAINILTNRAIEFKIDL